MKSKLVIKTSVFQGTQKEIFEKLQKLQTLQYIAYPYATFEAVDGATDLIWEEGKVFLFKFRLFGVIPFGIHTIRVERFDEERGIYTLEGNQHVPVWNHEIVLATLDENKVQYTDKIEIAAGWKTPFVCLWARMFYSHRQRKWKKLLSKRNRNVRFK